MPIDLHALLVPERTAFIIQEAQRGVIGDESALPELAKAVAEAGIVDRLALLARAARNVGVPVVHATAENLAGGFGANRNARLFAGARRAGARNTPGSSSVSPLPELGPEPGDIVLPRYHGLSPMTGGPLDSLLRNEGITTLVVGGVSLNVAIINLVFDAVNRAYQVVLARDAVAGIPLEYGELVLQHSLGLVATLATADEIATAWSNHGPQGAT